MTKPLSLFVTCCGLLAASAQASPITSAIDDLNADDYAVRQTARLELRQTLVDASPSELKTLERELLATIGRDQDWATRDWTLRMLELVGSKASVKPLTGLLHDEDPRIRDLARRALGAIPTRAAAAALEKAMLKAPADERGAYADALAYHRETGAVGELTAVLKTGSTEAALALGKIGNRSARNALERAHATATGAFKTAIEYALLDAGLTDRKFALELAQSGQTATIQLAAFVQLIDLDLSAARAALAATLADPTSPLRDLRLRAAMRSPLSDDVVVQLGALPEADQLVVLDAIADLNLARYEPAVLARLVGASPELQAGAVRTLGAVGSDASFQPLLDIYIADNRDREATAALTQLKAPSADANLLATARGNGAVSDREAALRLLTLRNTDGITPMLNDFAQAGNDPAIRAAAFKGMEVVGDLASVRRLLEVVLAGDALQRQAQGSLKKLSATLGVPDYLWTEAYAPALAAAPDNIDGLRAVLAIVDGNSGPAAADALVQLVLNDSPARVDALAALGKWTDVSGIDAWIAIAAAKGATPDDITAAKRAITRLVSSTRVTGLYGERVERAEAALRAFPDDATFKQAIVRSYDRELHWQTRQRINELFPAFLSDPDIAADVKELLERSAFN